MMIFFNDPVVVPDPAARALHNETEELDRLVAAGTLRAIDREHVRFSVRRIVHPPERADDPLPENVVGSA
jgi:hypothetical protein